jgi:hypothetical protein
VIFFALPGCNNAITSTQVDLTQTGTVPGFIDGVAVSFDQLEGTVASDPLAPGSATLSVRLQVGIDIFGAGQVAEVAFDNGYFGGDGTTPVALQSFGVE